MESSHIMHSYIVPCYNEAKTIALCLDSIKTAIDETGQLSEIIVVDCGSTDGSLEIIQDYNVTIGHIPAESRSYSKAVNLGFSMAQGTYVQIVDSDCALVQGWMNQALRSLENNPGLSAVAGTWVGNYQGSSIIRHRVERTTRSRSPFFQALGGPYLFVRDIVLHYPMDETLEGSADVDQIIRLKCAGKETARLFIPMLVQLKPEDTNFSKQIRTSFIRHGVGSGRGYRKSWGRSLRCLAWYHFAKKYHLFFTCTFLLLIGSLSCLLVGAFSLALSLFILVIGLYALTLTALYYQSKSCIMALQTLILKLVSALGFCWGLMKR
ncbi:MAG: glycosyltransferase family 2 protein [Desulfohalobiaceae bacterium]|nr:glycosyltransferase family 2 protein [Desulfohalobiaceae bacterium]